MLEIKHHFSIESLLSARILLSPQLAKERVYFMSDLSGCMSLYAMKKHGSLPVPLLPSGLALQNPHLMAGYNYYVLPELQKVLVMIDENGNENYQPCFVPLEGGIPEPIFGDKYKNEQVACFHCDADKNVAYFYRDDRKTPNIECLRVDLKTLVVTSLGTSIYGNAFNGVNADHTKVILTDGYTAADNVLYIWQLGWSERKLLYGIPLEQRGDRKIEPSGIGTCDFVNNDNALLFRSNLFKDEGSLTYMPLSAPNEFVEVTVKGLRHKGFGELVDVRQVKKNRFLIEYNIDGCSWVYEGDFRLQNGMPTFEIAKTLVGLPPLSNGVVLGIHFELEDKEDPSTADYVVAFTKANVPSQLYLIPHDGKEPIKLSEERVLGIDQKFLSEGEDTSYTSFDGIRISARLYMPSDELGFKGSRPLVLYVHGGPQGQERPDFTWFSMPLIQFLTLNGFAVFVPNVRGSTGYGLKFMKAVDRDWGGKDMQDQVEGLKMLEKNPRIDSSRQAVVGRSYGGYMTLMLASRHPKLWKASCDMFGPYNLLTFLDRIPETWKTYFRLAVGDPEKDKEFLRERSPITYLKSFRAPMLIIQGKNDPRVILQESKDVVNDLRANNVEVEFLVFEDEGHDVLKFKNKVNCYNKIVDFFKKHLEVS
jgi:pimeloyl-ACP methyl ester carboxylesterase